MNHQPPTIAEYAADLSQHGKTVVSTSSGNYWIKTEAGTIMRLPSFLTAPPFPGEVHKTIQDGKCLVATYTLEADENYLANAWLYICADQQYTLEKLPSAMRRNVRRGLAEFEIAPVSIDDLLASGVRAFCDTRQRVGLRDGTPEEFRKRFTARAQLRGHIFLGAWKNKTLAAFLSITEVDDWAEIEGSFSVTDLLNLRPNDTLIYYMLSSYLNERKVKLVSYGLSSIQLNSNKLGLHDFKKKVGFEAKPIHRVFVPHPLLKPLFNRLSFRALKTLARWQPGQRHLEKAIGVLSLVVEGQNFILQDSAESDD